MVSSCLLDFLYVKNSGSNEQLFNCNYIIDFLITAYKSELNTLTSPKIASNVGKQQHELMLARRDYMLAWFATGLEQCSVRSLREHENDILQFYTKRCHFSKSNSEYMLKCYIAKPNCDIKYTNSNVLSRIAEVFSAPLEAMMSQFGGPFVPSPVLEPSRAYISFHKSSYVKRMLIYHCLNQGYSSTGIAEVLRRFRVDTNATDAQIRTIKCEKNKQYGRYLAYVKDDFMKIPRCQQENSPKALEKIELYMDSGQFRFRENKA